MPAFLFSAGILVGLIGAFAIGFAIPIHEFSLGNALILVGTIAVVGGLVLVGLGAAVRELRHLARVFQAPARPGRSAETVGAPAPAIARGPAAGRIPFPAKPAVTAPTHAPRSAEARVDISPPEQSVQATAERPRPDIFSVARGAKAPPIVAEAESVPLSPMAAPGPAAPTPARSGAREEAVFEPKFAPEPATRADRPVSPAARLAPKLDLPRPPAESGVERPGRNLFDTVWPTGAKPTRETAAEPVLPASKPEKAGAFDQSEPTPKGEQREEAPAAAPSPAAIEPKPVSILKSGVIDGMAYTLYTDGSIEAQLPQGVLRFASVEDLRAHLDKNG